MKLTRFPFFFILLLTVAISIAAQDDTRASATWQVQKYDISATLPTVETDRSLTVKANLTVKNVSSSPAATLSLRISPLATIASITVNGATADFAKRDEVIGTGTLQRVSVRIPSVAPRAMVTASVDYKLTLKDNTGVGAISPTGSIFLPLSFWYPTPNSWYFARGADYAPDQIKITGPGGLTAVSSGSENGGAFSQALLGQPFFMTGNWDVINSGGVSVYVPKGAGADARTRADELARFAADARAFVASLLGTTPDAPLKLVAARRGAGFSQAGTILIDEGVFRRSKLDSLTAMNIAEGVVKLWIGGSVAVAGDGQGAIREGLPRFLATEFLENKFGKDVADIERTRQRMAYFGVARRDSPLSTVSPIDDYYFSEVANKGAMIWRLLDRKIGRADFFAHILAGMKDGRLDLSELRGAFTSEKDMLDYMFDHVTDTNLQVGLPQPDGTVNLRNAGSADVNVTIEAQTATGEKLKSENTIRSTSFGAVTFKTGSKITRVEIDPDKYYPQTDYSDDVAPKELNESDVLLAVKKAFDKQDFATAESTARKVLARYPRYDDVRVLLGRSLLGLGRTNDANTEFNAVLNEKLPTSKSLAWANEGMAEIAAKSGQAGQAAKYADAAILADAEYGASLAARNLRNTLNQAASVDADIKDYFARFDKAAVANRKADVEALIIPGDVSRFASGVAGSTEQWQTQVRRVDRLDADTVLAETSLSIKLLNKDAESGTAVFRLERVGNQWKLAAVDIFEVR